MAGKLQDDLTGNNYNNWTVVEYIGKSKYNCKCNLCNTLREIDGYSLKNGKAPKCVCETGKSPKGRIDLTGKQFGYWEVLEYSGNKKWKCRCNCGCNTTKDVAGSDLRNGKSTGCGRQSNRNLEDLTGQRFGDWLVVAKGPTGEHGETQWICECQCENKTKKLVTAYSLKSGNSKSCGHSTTGFKDIKGQQFGLWKVLYRSPVQLSGNSTDWVCECQCNKKTIRIISSTSLRNGDSKSCGCETIHLRIETNKNRYGVEHVSQIGTTRNQEQLDAIKSADNMKKFIYKHFDHTPSAIELGEALGIKRGTVKTHLENMDLNDKITHGIAQVSGYEKALQTMFPCDHLSDRAVLNGKELDLYYPEKNFAIEFNGNYWHSELKKEKEYHQNKTIEAARKGIFIYHIFEYEWVNKKTRNLIKQMISRYLYGDRLTRVFARECTIYKIDSSEADKFIDTFHLQGKSTADINLGCYYKDKLIGVMTFGKPRFNSNFEYELIRLCWHQDMAVVGGSQKLFKAFIKEYNPKNIISYCDISKFKGDVYTKLGFKLDSISNPNYKWINLENLDIKSRYQTQKHTLVKKGLGTNDQTESDIMHNLGYVKIYDCGNYRFVWDKDVEK